MNRDGSLPKTTIVTTGQDLPIALGHSPHGFAGWRFSHCQLIVGGQNQEITSPTNHNGCPIALDVYIIVKTPG